LWRKQTPDRFSRSRGWWLAKAWTWNFNREMQSDVWMGCTDAVLHNYWSVNGCLGQQFRAMQDDLTRGGPITEEGRAYWSNVGFSTDGRKWLSFDLSARKNGNEYGGRDNSLDLTINVKPLQSLSISSGPSLNRSRNLAQYLHTEEDEGAMATFGSRYVFATIDQTQLTLQTRVNWIVSPRASLQVFMQPLASTGRYTDLKELARPRTFAFRAYLDGGSTVAYDSPARQYQIDPDAFGPSSSFSLDDPDFNVKSLRLNAIFRWEFRPGSTLYAVWTEQREDDSYPGDFNARRDLSRIFSASSDDVFLLKMTYWIGR
jgi:hypothetical protein